jgi:hypothetical protein
MHGEQEEGSEWVTGEQEGKRVGTVSAKSLGRSTKLNIFFPVIDRPLK